MHHSHLPRTVVLLGLVALSACTVYEQPRQVYVPRQQVRPVPLPPSYQVPPVPGYQPAPPVQSYAPDDAVSVYVEPPIFQPEPILVDLAPPPMLVEVLPPSPFPNAVWIGGFWSWQGDWVWAAGRWAAPPRPEYVFVQPYYERRAEGIVFITGHWNAPGMLFRPPPPDLRLAPAPHHPGRMHGFAPIGPQGVFVPPPPGSRGGVIVPAPIGTPPAAVIGASPVSGPGMRIRGPAGGPGSAAYLGAPGPDRTPTLRPTEPSRPAPVTITAPASATPTGQPFRGRAPTDPAQAAAQPAAVPARAPTPMSSAPVQAYVSGRQAASLPPAQPVVTLPQAGPAGRQTTIGPNAGQDAAGQRQREAAARREADRRKAEGDAAAPSGHQR